MLIDTHCHLDFKDFEPDRQDVINRSREQGVGYIVNVGSSLEGTKESIRLAAENDFIYASAGIHPHEADNFTDKNLSAFRNLLDSKKVVAVGEIGLDYYKDISSRDNQRKMFTALLGEAKERRLPVIIHNRDAHGDTLRALKQVMGDSVRGVMHCFSGDAVFLKECVGMGMFVSFTCNITFKKAELLRGVAKMVPMERLVLETDAPFLAPQTLRGKRNEPAYIRYLAEEIARIKNVSFEEVAAVTTANAKDLFSI